MIPKTRQKSSTRSFYVRPIYIGMAALLVATGAHAQQSPQRAAPPLVIESQGSFFVNGQIKQTRHAGPAPSAAPQEITIRQMYVNYQVPATRRQGAAPVIMVHGGTHTGKTFETTPDNREGWSTYFVRQGFPTYWVDIPGRGRSGFDRSVINQARVEKNIAGVPGIGLSSNTSAWGTFRLGPSVGTPFPGGQFPTEAAEQYFAQLAPSAESTFDPANPNEVAVNIQTTTEAMVALLERIGPSVLLGHSRGGQPMITTAIAKPTHVKAIVVVEPVTCDVPDASVQALRNIPYFVVFGDYLDNAWSGRLKACRDTAAKLRAAGGTAEVVHLPEVGIRGNSHMIMVDRNSNQVADLIIKWIDARAQR